MDGKNSTIFESITREDADFFIWMGDAAYLDTDQDSEENTSVGEVEARSRYQDTKNSAGYSDLEKKSQILGVWDDHDFGHDNAGKELKAKNVNREIFLDFIGEPVDSERRTQKNTPIY
jgi:alkaline phosphatase D